MKNLSFLFLITLTLFNCENESVEETTCDNGTFVGDIILSTQQEVDEFGAMCYTKIEGNLRIGISIYVNEMSNINNLNALSSLTKVSGFLEINQNQNLENLNGLDSLTYFGGIRIYWNESLMSIDALSNNENSSLWLLQVFYCQNLQSLASFSNVTSVETMVDVAVMESLTSLFGIHNIISAKSFHLYQLNLVTSIVGLSITSTENFRIGELYSLESLDGLEILSVVNGFSSNSFSITYNPILNDFCALQDLFSDETFNLGQVSIYSNAYNPTVQDILDGNCSQ